MARGPKQIRDARTLTVRCLVESSRGRRLVPEAMHRFDHALSSRDLAFAHEMVYGTYRYLPGLEKVLARFCPKPKFPPEIRWLLLSSLYQIGFMRTKDYAVFDEANKLAVHLGYPRLKGLVNAVLRNAQRAGDALWRDKDGADWLLPTWLKDLLASQHGADAVADWTRTWRDRAELAYWRNDDPVSEEERRSDVVPHGFRRQSALPPEWLSEGRIYIQNESSQAVSELACRLKPKTVLDLCAAPGGKSCYVASFGGCETLVASDLASERVALIEENRNRLGLDFETLCADATQLAWDKPLCDLVMLDAPCSGIGILGRHPEIKHHKSQPADESLKKTQAALLKRGWELVAPGGYLLYTVCSLDMSEVPPPPEGAVVDVQALEHMPSGVPLTHFERLFRISPSNVFDGFCGMLLSKPK